MSARTTLATTLHLSLPGIDQLGALMLAVLADEGTTRAQLKDEMSDMLGSITQPRQDGNIPRICIHAARLSLSVPL